MLHTFYAKGSEGCWVFRHVFIYSKQTSVDIKHDFFLSGGFFLSKRGFSELSRPNTYCVVSVSRRLYTAA